MKAHKPRKHIIWIMVITSLMVLFEYISEGTIDKGTFVKAIIFALVLEFGNYCVDVYRKDNEEIATNKNT